MVVPSSFPALSPAPLSPNTSFPFSPPPEAPIPTGLGEGKPRGPKEECYTASTVKALLCLSLLPVQSPAAGTRLTLENQDSWPRAT